MQRGEERDLYMTERGVMDIEALEKKFGKLSQQIYQSGERRIKPNWPWVLVRVVPKEQKFGSLYLPDGDGSARQNKPLMEGIVLETWKPHWSKFRQKIEGSAFVQAETEQEVWRESEFKVGDRILFPSFAGLPVNFLDDKNYRLVREWTFDPNGGAVGIVNFDGDVKLKQELERVFENLESVTLSGK